MFCTEFYMFFYLLSRIYNSGFDQMNNLNVSSATTENMEVNTDNNNQDEINYLNEILSTQNIDSQKIITCDIKANTEFLQNSADDMQIFSFACFFENVLCQALGGEPKYCLSKNGMSIPETIPNKLTGLSYNIHKKFNYFGTVDPIELIVKSHCFIIMPEDQFYKVQKYTRDNNLKKYVTFIQHNNEKESKDQIAEAVNNKVSTITDNFISFSLNTDYMNQFNRIYMSIVYFKGSWEYDFDKCDQKKEFTKFGGQVIMRKYIQSLNCEIKYKKFEMENNKLVEAFVLPFHNMQNRRFQVIYLSPLFNPEGKNDLVKMYTEFIDIVAMQDNNRQYIQMDEFINIDANVFIPEFDQTCDEVNIIELLPETYQNGPAYHTKAIMKLRVKIDNKGIEGVAVMLSLCSDSCLEKERVIDIIVNKPYVALVYDDELKQTLFTIKDNGIAQE